MSYRPRSRRHLLRRDAALHESQGWEVKYVRNFTDIDDKIINRANRRKSPLRNWRNVILVNIKQTWPRWGVRDATIEPKATEYMPEIILWYQLSQKGAGL